MHKKTTEQAYQLLRQGKTEQALTLLIDVTSKHPEFLPGRIGLALAHQRNRRYVEAEEELLTCLQSRPEHADILFALANLYLEQKRHLEAEEIFRKLIDLHPRHAQARHNYANLLQTTGHFHEAVTQYLSALESHPEYPETWRDLGQLMLSIGEVTAGIDILERATTHFQNERETRFALGLAYLRAGNWTQGWPLYESRRAKDDPPPGPTQLPCWTTEPIENARILVTAEQGFGDCFLFARYLPELARIASKVSLWIPTHLWRIFASSFSGFEIDILYPGKPTTAFDFRLPFGSLPMALLTRGICTPPKKIPYLFANPEADPSITPRFLEWQSARPSGSLSAGIVWRGGATYAADATRSTSLSSLLALIPKEIINLASFQIDPSEEEKTLLKARKIVDLSGHLRDFHATANALGAVDIIITVDTAIANLAGAMGKPMVILQRIDSDWRWGTNRAGDAWFENVEPLLQSQI